MSLLTISRRGNTLVGQEMFKVLDKAKLLESQGKKIIHLELGQPRFSPPKNLIKSTINSLKKKDFGYSSSYGIYSFREKLRRRLKRKYAEIKVENIIISTANLLISQCLHLLTNAKDKIVVFSPTFPSYIAATNFLELDLIQIPLDFKNKFQVTYSDIDKAISANPKVIIINSANNPTGAVYNIEIIKYLKTECLKNNIWIISDETYSDIVFNKNFSSFLDRNFENSIVISSFSKIYSIPGYRLGYAVGRKSIIDKLSLSNSSLVSCHSIFTQKGVESILDEDKSYIFEINKKLKDLVERVKKIFLSSKALKENFIAPDAGYYIFLNISRSGLKGFDFCNMMLDKFSVACTPGISFGNDFDEYIRISICGNEKDVIEGVKKIVAYFDSL
jgi:aspartate/methionine/tyrosine aminotransferase